MGLIVEGLGRYDPYTDKFIKDSTDRVEFGTDGNLCGLSVLNGNEYSPKEKLYSNADMVAMLEDLDLQIDETAAYNLEVAKVQRLIRDKINALRGEGRRLST